MYYGCKKVPYFQVYYLQNMIIIQELTRNIMQINIKTIPYVP